MCSLCWLDCGEVDLRYRSAFCLKYSQSHKNISNEICSLLMRSVFYVIPIFISREVFTKFGNQSVIHVKYVRFDQSIPN